MQKNEVNRQACFRTNLSSRDNIVKEVKEVGPVLADLISKWESDPHAKPCSVQEKKAMKVLQKLHLVAKDVSLPY